MAQGVGEIGRYAKRTTQTCNVNGIGFCQQLYGAFQHFRFGTGCQLLERLGIRTGELLQDIERGFRYGFAFHLTEHARAVAVAGGFLYQVHTKQLFHFVEAGEVKSIGEADQRRGWYSGSFSNDGNRIKSHAIGIIQHIAGHLLQPLTQAIVAIADLLLQLVQAGCCCHFTSWYIVL